MRIEFQQVYIPLVEKNINTLAYFHEFQSVHTCKEKNKKQVLESDRRYNCFYFKKKNNQRSKDTPT